MTTTWELVGFNTDRRYDSDVRYRSYTASSVKAEAFARIPRIQFTDSGHGIVFAATEHRGKKLPRIYSVESHVLEHLRGLEREVRRERQAKQREEAARERIPLVHLTPEQEDRVAVCAALQRTNFAEPGGEWSIWDLARVLDPEAREPVQLHDTGPETHPRPEYLGRATAALRSLESDDEPGLSARYVGGISGSLYRIESTHGL